MCVITWYLRAAAVVAEKLHWSHLWDFSQRSNIIILNIERLVLFGTFVHLFPTVCQRVRLDWMFCRIVHICGSSLRCEWAGASSDLKLYWMMHLYPSKWVFRRPARLNELLHSAHLCDFPPLWMSMWVFRFSAWMNDLLHSEHMCNFSPMWVNIWLASWLEYLNDLTHMLQGCEFAMSKIWSVLLLLLVDNDWRKFVPTLFMICPSTKKSLPCTIFIMTVLLLDFSSLCGL